MKMIIDEKKEKKKIQIKIDPYHTESLLPSLLQIFDIIDKLWNTPEPPSSEYPNNH